MNGRRVIHKHALIIVELRAVFSLDEGAVRVYYVYITAGHRLSATRVHSSKRLFDDPVACCAAVVNKFWLPFATRPVNDMRLRTFVGDHGSNNSLEPLGLSTIEKRPDDITSEP